MDDAAWNAHDARWLGVFLAGSDLEEVDEKGNPIVGETLFIILSAHHESTLFTLPRLKEGERWERILDTAEVKWDRRYIPRDPVYTMRPHSLAVFRLRPAEKPKPPES